MAYQPLFSNANISNRRAKDMRYVVICTARNRHQKWLSPYQLQDLNRLFAVYQFWAHKMYPKLQFGDVVNRVEKLCHQKRLHVCNFLVLIQQRRMSLFIFLKRLRLVYGGIRQMVPSTGSNPRSSKIKT